MEFKTCKAIEDGGCGKTKPIEDFRLHERHTKGYRLPLCRECIRKNHKVSEAKRKVKVEHTDQDWSCLYKLPMTM